MNKNLLELYKKYANSEEARAILFVKKYLEKAYGNWIDIIKCQEMEYDCDENFCFRFVSGRLYKRKLKPKYPPKSDFKKYRDSKFDEKKYYLLCRAVTWETANKDITQQKSENIIAPKFEIKGTMHDKNKHCKGFFIDNAPAEIKALEKDLQNRTDPLWDKALEYVNKPELVFKIKNVKIYNR